MGGIIGGGKNKPPAPPPAPVAPDPVAVANKAALDMQSAGAAGASPDTTTNKGGAGGIPTSVLTGQSASLSSGTNRLTGS